MGLTRLAKEYRDLIQKADAENPGFYDFLANVIELEANNREQRSIAYRIRQSKLPQPLKLLADFDFSFQPRLSKKLIMDLAALEFLHAHQSVLFIGDCGTGKSHLARSLALIACQKGYRVFYTTCAALIGDLNMGVYEKTLARRLKKYTQPDLLVIDEMGHDRLELDVTKEAHLLFKVIDARYNKNASLIFTTNVEEQDWADYLGDPISTRAILDRIFHHSIKVEIRGPNMRDASGKRNITRLRQATLRAKPPCQTRMPLGRHLTP
ncbi:MAG: IS21-like element helper ATPase IstB [Candidatus Nitrosotenuis sp.]